MLANPLRAFLWCALLSSPMLAQFNSIHGNRPLRDAHNCYPYDGRYADRIDRALSTGFPVAIEQDLAWYVDSVTGKGRVVVSHTPKTTGSEATLRAYFFERVRTIVENALKENKRDTWPLIVLHFDFKDNQTPLLEALWDLLGEYHGWISTAEKTADSSRLQPITMGPLLVLTEESDLQEKVFFDRVPVGGRLRLFGSAHSAEVKEQDTAKRNHLLVSMPPAQLLPNPPTNYRRWWNNSWYVIEEGGAPKAGDWTAADNDRLKSVVDHAHKLAYWVRFYTLDGFDPADDKGWGGAYNFGSKAAVELRWKAALDAGVNIIPSDQYEEFAEFVRTH